MRLLVDRIKKDAVYLGEGIVKMDSFLNHQVDVDLAEKMAEAFCARFAPLASVTKILTAETSGIPAAMFVAKQLGVPLLFARKKKSLLMQEAVYTASAMSRTKQVQSTLFVSETFLGAQDSVLIIDDFLATGQTIQALVSIVTQSGAALQGIGCIAEKPQEGGRAQLRALSLVGEALPIHSLATIQWQDESLIIQSGS